MRYCLWMTAAGILLTACGIGWAKNDYVNAQYKRQGLNVISKTVDGKGQDYIDDIEEYLVDNPNDVESYYLLAMLYAQKGDIDKAMANVKGGIEKGLPAGRFIAGPRNLFKPLHDLKEFKEFIAPLTPWILHGPMVGNVTHTSASIWVRTSYKSGVQLLYWPKTGDKKNSVMSLLVNTSKETDYTAIVNIDELKPDTEYNYQLVWNSQISDVYSFRTFPVQGKGTKFSIGFGGGAGYTPMYEKIWSTLRSHDLTAFLFLGDNVYIDDPKKPAVQKFCYYRRQSHPLYKKLVAHTPIFSIWDDHDFTVNDGWGGPEIEEPAWKRDVWNVYKQNWVNPGYGESEANPGCWYDFYIGDVHFIMMDCRYYRENPKTDNPSMIGDVQKRWLKQTIKNSKGAFKVIASSVPWTFETKITSKDTWRGYKKERNEIFDFLDANKSEGVILISADRHRSDAWKIDRPNGYDLYEFESSKLSNMHTHAPDKGNLFSYNKKCSFGKLTFDTINTDPSVVYDIYNIDNEHIYSLKIGLDQLSYKK